jgi:hypothetical protein
MAVIRRPTPKPPSTKGPSTPTPSHASADWPPPHLTRRERSHKVRGHFACGAVLLAIIATACTSSPSSSPGSLTGAPASPTSVTLVHDLPADHPRIPYFEDFAESVSTRSGNELAVEINPNGEVLAGALLWTQFARARQIWRWSTCPISRP